VTFGSDGAPSFEFSAGVRSRDIDRVIEELLSYPGKIARDRHQRVAVVFDEFQQIVDIDPHLPGIMRAVFQMQGDVAHVFLGSKRHLMEEVFTADNQPLYKMAKPVVLDTIARDDFMAFIRERCAETGQDITDLAIAAILDITGGHPHDTQELCYFAWSLARAERLPVIDKQTTERALALVLDAESARYISLWDGLPAHQRLVLIALSTDPAGPIYSEGYRHDHRLGAASSVQRSVARLVARALIEPVTGNGYRIADVFLREWIIRRAIP
jgi:hypothetical protein